MALTPASSIAPASVTIAGTVDVSDRAARLLGHVDVDNFPATQPVSGSVSVSNFPATQPVSGSVSVGNFPADQVVHFTTAQAVDASGFAVPVTGPLTDAELRALAVTVDGSAVTQPVAAESLPLPDGAASEATLNRARRSLDQVALATIIAEDVV